MIQNISYKDFFIRYGIFVAILVILIGLLIYPIKASKKFWTQNLKTTIEIVLDENNPNGWTVEKSIPINNTFSTNAACYEARNRKTGDLYKALIIRVQTLYGPLPAVFIMDKDQNVSFIGYSSLHGVVNEQLMNNSNSKRINYWINKIPTIFDN